MSLTSHLHVNNIGVTLHSDFQQRSGLPLCGGLWRSGNMCSYGFENVVYVVVYWLMR